MTLYKYDDLEFKEWNNTKNHPGFFSFVNIGFLLEIDRGTNDPFHLYQLFSSQNLHTVIVKEQDLELW